VLEKEIRTLLSDLPRAGRKPKISDEQQAAVFKKACEDPKDSDRPIAKWTRRELSLQLIAEGIFDSISGRWIGELLNRAAIRPHKNKYWLTSKDKGDPNYNERVADICAAYREAIPLYQNHGIHTICIDEQTGIQALERIAPDLLPRPGMPMLREYEYKRHGTLCLFGNFHVPTGMILEPMLRQTRTEEDYLENLDSVISLDPEAGYRLIADNLSTHSSESCVRYVAASCGIEEDLGKKGVRGILKSVASRVAFLTDPSHRIQFLFTPRHCSWLNQIEIWFGTLRNKVTRWGSFNSLDALQHSIESFIDYFNETMARPYNWTYSGKVLRA
jgi:transposase